MSCDRDDPYLSLPSPCSRAAPPPAPPPHEEAMSRCESALLDLLTTRPTPTDAEIVATVHRARRLLVEAVATSPR